MNPLKFLPLWIAIPALASNAFGQEFGEKPANQATTQHKNEPVSNSNVPEKWFLVGSKRLEKDGGTIEVQAGAIVRAIQDNGKTYRVSWEGTEFEVEKPLLTNDAAVAAKAVKSAEQRKADLAGLDAFVKSNGGGQGWEQTVAEREAELKSKRAMQVQAALARIPQIEEGYRKEKRQYQQNQSFFEQVEREKAQQRNALQQQANAAELRRLESQSTRIYNSTGRHDQNLQDEIRAKRGLQNGRY